MTHIKFSFDANKPEDAVFTVDGLNLTDHIFRNGVMLTMRDDEAFVTVTLAADILELDLPAAVLESIVEPKATPDYTIERSLCSDRTFKRPVSND